MSETPTLLEAERQLILLGLALLAAQRPVWWRPALVGIAAKLDGVDLFDFFLATPPAGEEEAC